MAPQNTSYPCPRCGKERIIAKQWQEPASTPSSGQPTHHTLMICPDPQCQQKLTDKITAEKDKRIALQQAKEQRYADSQQRSGRPSNPASKIDPS